MHALGYAAMACGDTFKSLAWYERYLALVRDTENELARNLVIGRAAQAFLRAGRIDEAEGIAERALAVAEAGSAPHYSGLARQVQGSTFEARSRYDAARSAYDDAIAIFARIGSRLERARTVLCGAVLASTRGDVAAAHADALHARDEFAAMAAAGDRARADELLAAL
jgi:tetratricopeptide (TPR) repeat protein